MFPPINMWVFFFLPSKLVFFFKHLVTDISLEGLEELSSTILVYPLPSIQLTIVFIATRQMDKLDSRANILQVYTIQVSNLEDLYYRLSRYFFKGNDELVRRWSRYRTQDQLCFFLVGYCHSLTEMILVG